MRRMTGEEIYVSIKQQVRRTRSRTFRDCGVVVRRRPLSVPFCQHLAN